MYAQFDETQFDEAFDETQFDEIMPSLTNSSNPFFLWCFVLEFFEANIDTSVKLGPRSGKGLRFFL